VLLCVMFTGQPAEELLVHLCTEPQQQHLLTPQHIRQDTGTTPAAAGATAASEGLTTPSRKPSAAPAQSAASSSSSKKAKPSSKSSKQQQQELTQKDSTTSGLSAAAQWQLQLLQDGLDWSKPRQRQLLQQLVHKQLLGRSFLPGNVVYVPLLGAKVLCLLQPSADAAQQQQRQQALAGVQPALSVDQPPLSVTSSTQLQLLPQNEQQSGLPVLQAVLASPTTTDTTTAAAGPTGSSGPAGSLQQSIALAREAAAAAVDGSAQDAAMEAAERAVRAGGWEPCRQTPHTTVTVFCRRSRLVDAAPLVHQFTKF
jgi:hypothetical protein